MSASLEAARKFVTVLEKTQYYPPDRMQTYQRRLLQPLLHHARREVSFYATRLDPLFAPDGSIRWDAWADIPTFTRADAQQADDALFAKSYPEQMGNEVSHHRHGSVDGHSYIATDFRLARDRLLRENGHHCRYSRPISRFRRRPRPAMEYHETGSSCLPAISNGDD